MIQGKQFLLWNVRNVTVADSPVTAVNGDWIRCDTTGGPIAVSVPNGVDARAGVKLKVLGPGNNVTVSAAAGTIDGGVVTLSVPQQAVTTIGVGAGGCDVQA